MSALDDLLKFHTERGSLGEFGLGKLADQLTKAQASMDATIAAEQADREARLEAERIHPWPLTQSIASPDDWIVWTVDGRIPNLDSFEHDGLRYRFVKPDSLYMFTIPAAFADTLPTREAMGWSYCRAHEALRLHELGGTQALQLIESVPLGLAIFRRLSVSSHRNAVAAATVVRNRLAQLGRDVTQTALPVASFYREWQAQDRAADRIAAMAAAASRTGVIEPLADDPDDVQRALADQQTRDSLAKLQHAEASRKEQADREAVAGAELLASIARDVAELKSNAAKAAE